MFKELYKAYESYDNSRERVISLSREVVRLSKKIISSVHKSDFSKANAYKKQIEEKLKLMRKEEKGMTTIALQEYVEAILFLEYAKSVKIIPFDKFECTPEEYIMGLCDVVGELQRRAVMKIAAGDKEYIKKTYATISEIYDGLLDFSFRGEVRKKFDFIKYMMIKQEDIMMELKLK